MPPRYRIPVPVFVPLPVPDNGFDRATSATLLLLRRREESREGNLVRVSCVELPFLFFFFFFLFPRRESFSS